MKGGNAVAFLGLFIHSSSLFPSPCSFLDLQADQILIFNKYLIGMLYAVFVNLIMEQVVFALARCPINHLILLIPISVG